MLVLTRRLRESVKIGDVEVYILDISRSRVKIGIEAPRDMTITRSELKDKEEK